MRAHRSFLVPLFFLTAPLQAGQVIFTEVMYNPPAGKPEYIEITNLTSNRADTASWTLSDGVAWAFPAFAPASPNAHFLNEYGRFILSSADEATTRAAWPAIPPTVRIMGPWTGALNNAGDTIVLKDAAGAVQSTLTYGDGGDWPLAADGAGHSLQIINQNGNVDDWRNWRASRYAGGTPGVAEPALAETLTANEKKLDLAVVDFSSAWKYWLDPADPDGAGPEGSWYGTAFNDSTWQGPSAGFFGHDPNNAALQAQRGTSFTTGYANSTITYYFRTTFNWTGAATGNTFGIDQWVDDGVVYYLNGQELKGANLGRVRMAAGIPTHTTLATGTPSGGDAIQEINLPNGTLGGQLVSGTNVLTAEVHQSTVSNDDIYFGARLRISAPAVGGTFVAGGVMINEVRPSTAVGVGFVEFYNPTGAAVDLNGYYLSDTEASLTKYKITVPTVVPAGGMAAVGFAESGLGITYPVPVILTQPDGLTRQAAFQSSLVVDGRSIGRKPDGGSTWVLFTEPSRGLSNVTAPAPTVALSEVHFAGTGRADWVEIYNKGTGPQALTGFYVSSSPDLVGRVPLAGSLAAGGYASVAVDFPTDAGGDLRLFLSDAANNVLAATEVKRRVGLPSVQAWPAGENEWYATAADTRDAANNPVRETAVVITEIMAKPPSAHEEGEFIELYNQSGAAVNLEGWAFTDGISYDFPAGTTLAAGAWLVLAKDPAWMTANYPGLTGIKGPFNGSLRNNGEKLRLEDARGNLADLVDYKQGGQWPVGAGGEGSSLELLNPAMDNSQPSSWRASDETGKTTFQTFTHTGTYKELRGIGPGASTSRELLVNLVGDGHVLLRNIKLSKATAPTVNMIAKGDATSHSGTGVNNGSFGFLCTGTHCDSDTLPRVGATITGDPGFHLISQGTGDTKANLAQVDLTGLLPNDVLTLTFEGRWLYGMPLMVAQTWDRSFGKLFRFPVPNNLGTPGAANSRGIAAPAPEVDFMKHSPPVPTSTQPVVVSARVSSATPLGAVSLLQRLDSTNINAAWTTLAMNDGGTNGDVLAGDGIWSATVPARANAAITQFYIKAAAANGQENECPRQGATRPGMWIVANTVPSVLPGTLIQRNIISVYHRNALNASTGFSLAYDWNHPRMSNYGFNSTMIFNETEVLYNCELRRGGSPWTRTSANTLDRTRWKPPGDQLFRERTKSGVDNDSAGVSRFHNRIVRHMLYLFGYPVPDAEFIQQIVNGDAPRIGDEQEQTDSDFFDRAYADGSEGELFEIDDAWFMYDTNNMDDRLDAGSVTGRWELRDWNNSTPATPSDESPIFFHGNWPVRFPEERYDYAALSSMIKTAVNGNAAVTAAQEVSYRERMDRVLDADRAALYAAVRGYVGDWDNFTMNRGKNSYFYRRPNDGRFEFHHWDSDLAFQNTAEAFLGSAGGTGWTNLTARPWFKQKMNYYLSQLIDRYTISSSARMNAWLAAMNYQSANSNGLAPFKTNGFSYPTWFTNRRSPALSFITTTNYNRPFSISTAQGQTVTTPRFTIAGAASTKVAYVDIPGHPEAVFSWVPTSANNGLWTLTNVALTSGLNTLSVRSINGDGAVGGTLSFAVTLTGNAPPVASLVTNPGSGNVALGETLLLDATGSVDPEGLALSYLWSVSPATGAFLTQPEFGKATARFTVPGSYILTLQVVDAVSQITTVTREFSVFNTSGFASFTGGNPLGPEFNLTNLEERDNFSPSTWYSVEDTTGRLLIQVLDDSAKPLEAPAFTHPQVMRDLPDSTDFMLQSDFRPDTREFGNWRAGLLVQVNEGGTIVRYAFGLDAGVNLLVQRAALPSNYTTLSTTAVTGSGAALRIVRNGASLLFQRRNGTVWTTLFTQALPAGSVALDGGLFVSTSQATTVRIGFDYLLLADPTATNSLLNNLRITELHYFPAPGGVEFIELRNTGTQAIDLSGVSFGIGNPFSMAGTPELAYTFGNENLAPGGFICLTDNVTLFRSLYGLTPRLAPPWTRGSLSNTGEKIVLLDPTANAIHDFDYGVDIPWPQASRGTGPSMEVIDVNGDYNLPSNWRASAANGGTPGSEGGLDTDGDGATDAVEALFGTNPNSPGSLPAANLTANPGGDMTLTWPSVAGVIYRVQSCTPLTGWVTVQTLTGTGSWSFTPTPGEPRRFYRVSAATQ